MLKGSSRKDYSSIMKANKLIDEFYTYKLVLSVIKSTPAYRELREKNKKLRKQNKQLRELIGRLLECDDEAPVKIKIEPMDHPQDDDGDVVCLGPIKSEPNIVYEICEEYISDLDADEDEDAMQEEEEEDEDATQEEEEEEDATQEEDDEVAAQEEEEEEEEEAEEVAAQEEEEEAEDEEEEEASQEDEEEEEEEVAAQEEEEEAAQEEEEEVYEMKIKGKSYYVSNEKNGKIYGIDENGDVADEVGKMVNGKAIFG